MTRLKDTIINGDEAYAADHEAPMVDLKNGGQQGHMPNFTSIISNAPYVRRNLIAILVEAPRGFQYLENPDKWVEALKAMVEVHCTGIEGLNDNLEVEFGETPVGGAGEVHEVVTNVTRERSTPTMTLPEKYGMPINALMYGWITNLMMDPETKYPRVISNGNLDDDADLLPDFTGMTVMFIEPDPLHMRVQKSWLSTNMMPNTSGERTGVKEITSAHETIEHSIEFSAITQVGLGVNRFAQRLLDEINMTGVNPNLRQPFVDQLTADVRAADKGYQEQIDEASRTGVDQ